MALADAAGRTLTVDTAGVRGEVRRYDPEGNLASVEKAASGGTPRSWDLVWDTAVSVPQVLSLGDGSTQHELVYGDGRAFAVEPDGSAATFAIDPVGSVRPTPATASLVAGDYYEPFGEPAGPHAATTAKDALTFGYRGELNVGGHVHLRNRDLDPTTGRFTTPDPYDGVSGRTTLGNRFHYADNNPVNRADPLGLYSIDDFDFLVVPAAGGGQVRFFEPAFFDRLPTSARQQWLNMLTRLAGGRYDYTARDRGSSMWAELDDTWSERHRANGARKMDAYIDATGHIPTNFADTFNAAGLNPVFTAADKCTGYVTNRDWSDCGMAVLETASLAYAGVGAVRAASYARTALTGVGVADETLATGRAVSAPLGDALEAGNGASTSWGRTIEHFKAHGDQWSRVSAHAEGASGRIYRAGTSIEEVFERGADRLVRHRIYGPNGEILHETFRPNAKFGAAP